VVISSGFHVGSAVPWTVVRRHRLSGSIVQPWLGRVKNERRHSKGFRTLDHRKFPLPPGYPRNFMAHTALGNSGSTHQNPFPHTPGRFLRPNPVPRVPKCHRSSSHLKVCRKGHLDTPGRSEPRTQTQKIVYILCSLIPKPSLTFLPSRFESGYRATSGHNPRFQIPRGCGTLFPLHYPRIALTRTAPLPVVLRRLVHFR